MLHQNDGQESHAGFRQTTRTAGQITQGTAQANPGGPERLNSKLAYYSDEEEDGMTAAHAGTAQRGALKPQFSESGRTQMTQQNAHTKFNIADENDEINM